MKRKIVAAMLSTMLISVASASVVSAMDSSAFTDVSSYTSFYKYIEKVVDDGIMEGTSNTEFGVSQKETRLDFIKSLHAMAKSPLVIADSSFADVKGTDGEVAVVWAENKGLFDGLKDGTFTDGNFGGDKELSRSELAQILYNYAKNIQEIDMTRGVGDCTTFDDAHTVSNEYKDALNWAVGNGILVGDDRLTDAVENSLRPNETANKTEVAEALYKYMDLRDTIIAEMNATATPVEKAPVTDATLPVSVKTGIALPDSKTENTQVSTDDKNKENDGDKKDDKNNSESSHEHTWIDNVKEILHPETGHYEKQKVKDAWTETINHEAEYEDVYVKDADAVYKTVHHDAETHEEQQYVKDADAVYKTVHHPAETHTEKKYVIDKEAVYDTIHHEAEGEYQDIVVTDKPAYMEEVKHPAVYEDQQVWVETKPAWDETVHHEATGHYETQTITDQEAWDEPIMEWHTVCFKCGHVLDSYTDSQIEEHMDNHFFNEGFDEGWGDRQIQVGTKHHDAITHEEQVWVEDTAAWDETIHHEAEGHYETQSVLVKEAYIDYIWHDAITHTERQWVETKPAWDEQVLVSPEEGHYEDVEVIDKEAWDEEVLVTPEQGHYETVTIIDKEAYDEEVLVTPEQGHYVKKLIKDAWVETIDHDAVYEDIWVVDTAEWVETVTDGKKCTECGLIQK